MGRGKGEGRGEARGEGRGEGGRERGGERGEGRGEGRGGGGKLFGILVVTYSPRPLSPASLYSQLSFNICKH